jgi:hypothetical protein
VPGIHRCPSYPRREKMVGTAHPTTESVLLPATTENPFQIVAHACHKFLLKTCLMAPVQKAFIALPVPAESRADTSLLSCY